MSTDALTRRTISARPRLDPAGTCLRVAVVTLLVVAPASCDRRGPAESGPLNLEACADAADWWHCARLQETELISQSTKVTRHGDTLVIHVPGQPPVRLVDEVDDWGFGHHYLYAGFMPVLPAHVVDLRLYEGGSHLLVWPRSGQVQALDALPIVSPGGDRVVTASWDTEAGYNPNRVRILRKQADSLAMEWELEPQLWGPDRPRWLNDSTVVVLRRPALGHPDSASLSVPLTLRLSRNGWAADSSYQPWK